SFGRLPARLPSLKRRSRGIAEKAMQRRYHLRALADRAAEPLDRSRAHVADGEHAGHRSFQRRHKPSVILFGRRAGHHKTPAIEGDAATVEPAGGRIGADEQKEIAEAGAALFTG